MSRRRKKPIEKKRLTEQQIVTFGQIFPGFDVWYRANYDEDGNLKPLSQRPAIPGLMPPYQREGQQEEDN